MRSRRRGGRFVSTFVNIALVDVVGRSALSLPEKIVLAQRIKLPENSIFLAFQIGD
jgi:hypothetical protein